MSRKEKGKTGLIAKTNRNPQAKLKTLNKELFQGPELRRARLAAAQTAATSCLERTETGSLPMKIKAEVVLQPLVTAAMQHPATRLTAAGTRAHKFPLHTAC